MITLNDILNKEAQAVSRNFYDYTNCIYGASKIGKSSLNAELYKDNGFFIFGEPRYNHLEGIKLEYVQTWSEFLQVVNIFIKNKKQLLPIYPHIIISGVENLLRYCKEYTLSEYDVEDLNDVGYGQAHAFYFDQWNKYMTILNTIGYKVHYELHSTEITVKVPVKGILPASLQGMQIKEDKKTNERYVEYNKIVPDMKSKFLNPLLNIVDNILYVSMTEDENGEEKRCIHLRESMYWMAGLTFKGNVPEVIEFDAQTLRKTFEDAIGGYEITKEKQEVKVETKFEDVIKEVGELGKQLCTAGRREELTKVIEKYLGVGAKVSEAKENQKEQVELILMELKELV